VDVLGSLVDGEQLPADWPFLLRYGFAFFHKFSPQGPETAKK
jgi:hypothetical protein